MNPILAIGASTGGTRAIEELLLQLPVDCPATVIVQHIPEHFSLAFAERLNELCKMVVREAKQGDDLMPGLVLIAPGNAHMIVRKSGSRNYVEIKPGPTISGHCPSVDVLFRSVARLAGPKAIGVLLTGMGSDGAKGMLEMREAGAITLTQDRQTCVVYGMPMQAVKLGASMKEVPLKEMAAEIEKCVALLGDPNHQ